MNTVKSFLSISVSAFSVSAFSAAGLLAAVVLGVFTFTPAWAQVANPNARGDSLGGIENRVQQLEYKLNQLRRDVDTGGVSSFGTATESTTGSGFSSGGASVPQGFAARAEIRMGELEEELTRLTGKIEDLGFSVSRLTTRLDKLVEDVDFRLSALERSRPTASPVGASTTVPAPKVPATGKPSFTTPRRSETAGRPRSLGTISPRDLAGKEVGGGPPAGRASGPPVNQARLAPPRPSSLPKVLPNGTPKEQYDFAYKLLRQGDYAKAERAFREFGKLNPNDPLAGNARYWLGETYYVRQDFVQAADVFIGVVTGYPNSPKRPHSMLKLGMSLLAMGQKQEGCATLNELLHNYPKGADATRTRAEKERERAGCS